MIDEGSPLIAAWALARDVLARPQGRAGYLSIPHPGIEPPIDPNADDPYDRYLVVDLPLFGARLQISYRVDRAFIHRWPLPPYLGALVAHPDNATALETYGGYIAAARLSEAARPAPPSDPEERVARGLGLSGSDRAKVRARRSAHAAQRAPAPAGRPIGVVKGDRQLWSEERDRADRRAAARPPVAALPEHT